MCLYDIGCYLATKADEKIEKDTLTSQSGTNRPHFKRCKIYRQNIIHICFHVSPKTQGV